MDLFSTDCDAHDPRVRHGPREGLASSPVAVSLLKPQLSLPTAGRRENR